MRLAELLSTKFPDEADYSGTAEFLEKAIRKGDVPEKLSAITRLCCSICYELATEYRFKELLQEIPKLTETSLVPLNEIMIPSLSKRARDMILLFCEERFQQSFETSSTIQEIFLKLGSPEQANYQQYVHPATIDEVRTLADLVIFTQQSSGWLLAVHPEKGKQVDLEELLSQLRTFDEVLERREFPAWMYFLSKLYTRLMMKTIDRLSIHSAFHRYTDACSVALDFIRQGYPVLWPTQIDPIVASLQQKDVLLSAETGTGKSLLGAILIASKRQEAGISVYAVPTRALAHQISTRIAKLAYGGAQDLVRTLTMEDEVSVDELKTCKALVGTYEKIEGLFRENLLSQNDVNLFVIDECHNISDFNRGVTLDFLLTQMNPRFQAQRMMLSSVLPEEQGQRFAQWAKAEYMRGREWRRTKMTEKIGIGRLELEVPREEDRDSRTKILEKLTTQTSTPTRKVEEFVVLKVIELVRQGKVVLVTAESRPKVEELAAQIAAAFSVRITSPLALDVPLRDKLEENMSQVYRYVSELRASELVLPRSTDSIAKLLSRRVVFHHAGLPKSLRSIIEEMIENRIPLVVVSTTTLEAGVNFPVDSVIVKRSVLTKRVRDLKRKFELKDPLLDYVLSRYENILFSAYRNIIGRAGRAGFAESGESIFYVDNIDEALAFLDMRYRTKRPLGAGADLFTITRLNELSYRNKLDPLHLIAKDLNQSRGRLLSNLLHAVYRSEGDLTQIVAFLRKTWLWRVVSDLPFIANLETTFPRLVSEEIQFLVEIEFVKAKLNQNFELTPIGSFVNRSLLNPMSAKKIIDVLKAISFRVENMKEEDLESCILNAVGLAYEMRLSPLDRPPKPTSFIDFETALITSLKRFTIPHDGLSVRIAAILRGWSKGIQVDDIIREFRLHDSDHGLIEELIPKTAIWVLHSMKMFIMGLDLPSKHRILALVEKVTSSVAIGTDDEVARSLLEFEIPSLGRNSAVYLVETFHPQSVEALASVDKAKFEKSFPGKEKIAANVLLQISKHVSTSDSET